MAHKLIALILIFGAMLGLALAQENAPYHFSNCPNPAVCCSVPVPMMTVPVPGGTPTVVPMANVVLYGAHASSANGTFLQFFDATATPAAGATPIGSSSWTIVAGQDRDVSMGPGNRGWSFTHGVQACCSSTQATFTAGGPCGFLLEWY